MRRMKSTHTDIDRVSSTMPRVNEWCLCECFQTPLKFVAVDRNPLGLLCTGAQARGRVNKGGSESKETLFLFFLLLFSPSTPLHSTYSTPTTLHHHSQCVSDCCSLSVSLPCLAYMHTSTRAPRLLRSRVIQSLHARR